MKTALRRLLLAAAALAALSCCVLAAEISTPSDFYAALEANIRAQNKSFTIHYTGDRRELNATQLGPVLRSMSALSPDGPDNADYPALNVDSGLMLWNGSDCSFQLKYIATQGEIDQVDRMAEEIVAGLALENEDSFTRIKLVYEYICTHYTYDDTLTKFSAYDGLTTGSMVCQGYALLTYKLMWKAGIPCRAVTGVSRDENHAWNIVKLDGKWYNLDTTWDAMEDQGSAMSWNYFLCSQADFPDHTRFQPFSTAAYVMAHPIATTSRELQEVSILSGGQKVSGLVVRVGVPVTLEVALPDGISSQLRWSSSDPSVISVDEDGVLEAHGIGTALITVGAGAYRGVISAQVSTQAVDLRAASAWAFDAVTEYYLAQLLPPAFCADFKAGITRGELAELCSQYIATQVGWKPSTIINPFGDIGDSGRVIPILRCVSIGLMVGVSEDSFAPDRVVTREQAATVLVRLAAYLDGEALPAGEGLAYADADQISAWAAESISAASAAGLLQGSEGSYYPKSSMTREQMIVALDRIYAQRRVTAAAA